MKTFVIMTLSVFLLAFLAVGCSHHKETATGGTAGTTATGTTGETGTEAGTGGGTAGTTTGTATTGTETGTGMTGTTGSTGTTGTTGETGTTATTPAETGTTPAETGTTGSTTGSMSGTTGTGATASDATITAAVQRKLQDKAARTATNVQVQTQNGVVTLTGTVTTQVEADRIIALAKSVPNVSDVQSQIQVKQQ